MKHKNSRLFSICLMTCTLLAFGCKGNSSLSISSSLESFSSTELTYKDKADIDKELLGCFNYFNDCPNLTEGSAGYGLTQDRLSRRGLASIAATGFSLACYPSFVEMNYITKAEGEKRTLNTYNTILRLQNDSTQSYGGCLYHFMDKNSGVHTDCEISTIDTAILLGGVIAGMEYFTDNSSIRAKGNEIWSNVDYTLFKHKTQGTGQLISMGCDSSHNLLSDWDMTAEQLMMYVFGAGNPNASHQLDKTSYDAFKKPYSTYDDYKVFYSWNGSIFTYQFSHAFIDFSKYKDANGLNWWQNSVNASLASRQFSIDYQDEVKSYSEYAWGLTACDTPLGYSGALGALPRGGGKTDNYAEIEGTIAPCGALGSIVFTPDYSLSSLGYYQSLKNLNDSTYGLMDSYCLDFGGTTDWYCDDAIGIDKGITAMMLYSYKNPMFNQNLVMKNTNILSGLNTLGFTETK